MLLIGFFKVETAYAHKIRLRGRGFAIRIPPVFLIYSHHYFKSYAYILWIGLQFQRLDLRYYNYHACP